MGLIEYAASQGIAEIDGLLPDNQDVFSGLKDAGLQPDADDECLCLFELNPSTIATQEPSGISNKPR